MATFPTDAVATVNSITFLMSDRRPDRGFSIKKTYKNNIFVSQSGHEKRNSISRRPKRSFSLEYKNISGGYKEVLEQFYDARLGDFEAFNFDSTYIGLVGTILVRFDGDIDISEVVTSTTIDKSIYNVTINLTETFT